MVNFSTITCAGTLSVIWWAFGRLDKLSRNEFKRLIAHAITNSSIFTVGAMLPGFVIFAFQAIFTAKVFSLRGFLRSCFASVVVVALLMSLWYSSVPGNWIIRISHLANARDPTEPTWIVAAIEQTAPGYHFDLDLRGVIQVIPSSPPVPTPTQISAPTEIHRLDTFVFLPILYNFIADFGALLLTSGMLNHIARQKHASWQRLLVSGVLLTGSIFVIVVVGLAISGAAMNWFINISAIHPASSPRGRSIWDWHNLVRAISFPIYRIYPDAFGGWSLNTLYGPFIWSTLMGVVWVSIFSLSVIIANLSTRLLPVGPWIATNFRVIQRPFQVLAFLIVCPGAILCAVWHLL